MAPDTFDEAVRDTKDAAKQLAAAATQLSKRLLDKAEIAARDPKGSAKKVARRVAKELDAASREIDRILKEL
jgi:cell division septum initiation protein DivIVA